MGDLLIKMLLGIGRRMLTEALLSRLIVHSSHFLAQKTTNKLDDQMVDTVAEALGVKGYK
jgi:hypothetical protein